MHTLNSNFGRGDFDSKHGIVCTPQPGDKLTITYNGLLSKSGATEVWMRTGTGEPRDWNHVYDHYMVRTPAGFECTFDLFGAQNINLCFKDSANNWDNNNGNNWRYQK